MIFFSWQEYGVRGKNSAPMILFLESENDLMIPVKQIRITVTEKAALFQYSLFIQSEKVSLKEVFSL